MSGHARERGLVLPILLALTMSVALLAGQLVVREPRDAPSPEAARRQTLLGARRALLAYALGYAELYGPRGAGPGHFPCPDTDVPGAAGMASTRDGPNPPCGRAAVAFGWLPARVRHDRGVHRFHDGSGERPRYRVDSAFVNNPLDRIVNTASEGSLRHGGRRDIVAVIGFDAPDADSGPAGAGGHPAGPSVAVHMDALREALGARVITWLLHRIDIRHGGMDVRTVSGEGDPAGHPVIDMRRILPCDGEWRPDGRSGWMLLPLLLDELPHADTDPGPASDRPVPRSCEQEEAVASHRQTSIEGVAARRHWLLRNRWLDQVGVTVAEACRSPVARCRLRPHPIGARAGGHRLPSAPALPMRLRLDPVGAAGTRR